MKITIMVIVLTMLLSQCKSKSEENNALIDKFVDKIKISIAECDSNPSCVCDKFFNYYEPIFFSEKDFMKGLDLFDSPLKEIIAAHQAWGMIGSDGFGNYFDQTDNRFDEVVKSGFKLLGHPECFVILMEAKKNYAKEDDQFSIDLDNKLWDEFYEPIRDLEEIIGLFLIGKYGKS